MRINGEVADWYIRRFCLCEEGAVLPKYSKEKMLEAFSIMEKANNLRPVQDDGKQVLSVVCAPSVAEMVVEVRGW